MAVDTTQPINLVTVKTLVRDIVLNGEIVFTQHAEAELTKDGLDSGDALNVLKGGSYSGPEFENGGWRYRVEGRGMAVIFELDSETCCIVITGWRFKR